MLTLNDIRFILDRKVDEAFQEFGKQLPMPPVPRIIIEYYTENVYGKLLDYVQDERQAKIIKQLTGKVTIDSATRELLRDLTAGAIQWKQL